MIQINTCNPFLLSFPENVTHIACWIELYIEWFIWEIFLKILEIPNQT